MTLRNLPIKITIIKELIFFSFMLKVFKSSDFISKSIKGRNYLRGQKLSKLAISSMVSKGAKFLGIKKCLVISIVIQRQFKRYGYDSKIIIGWQLTDKFYSHSWVECESEYFPPNETLNSKQYKEIKIFE